MEGTVRLSAAQAQWAARWPMAVLLAFTACIAGRVLTFPINRDEHMFVTVAQQFANGDLYRDMGYNHLPNLPLLLAAIFNLTGTDHFLLLARLTVVVAWALALYLILRIGTRLGASRLASVTAMALMAGNVTLLGPPGMLATNSLLPIPFAFLAFHLLQSTFDPQLLPRHRIVASLLAGVAVSIAIGFKANLILLAPVVALATLLAPHNRPLRERISLQCLPLALGGLVGGLPAIVYFARDPDGMIAHTLRYFTVLHTSFWSDQSEPKVMSMAGKLLLAEEIWIAGTSLLAFAGILLLAMRPYREGGWSGVVQNLLRWPVLLAGSLAVCGVAISFVPTPSFTQYFVPPIPFVILAFLALCADSGKRPVAGLPILLPLLVIALIAGSVRLLPGLVALGRPGEWTGIAANRVMHEVLDEAGIAADARIATMSPILVIEGGRQVYPEFAAGQFIYRVAPYMTQEERQYYRTTAPAELAAFLDANTPDAILIDTSEPIEGALVEYSRLRNLREVEVDRKIGSLAFRLFVPRSAPGASEGR